MDSGFVALRRPGMTADHVLEHQAEEQRQGSADRAVQARRRRVLARHRRQRRSRSEFRLGASRSCRRQGAAAGAAAPAQRTRSCDRARPCRFDCVAACLPRSGGAPEACARRPAGARGVRSRRTGPRRGHRLAPHGWRRQEPHRHARRPLPPRQIRRHYRSRRRAHRRGARHDGARAAHRRDAAGGRAQARRFVAAR